MKAISQILILLFCLHITVLSHAQKKVNIDSEVVFTEGKNQVPFRDKLELRVLMGATFTTNPTDVRPADPILGLHSGIGIAYYFTPSIKLRLGLEYRNNNRFAFSVCPSSTGHSSNFIAVPILFEKQFKRWTFFSGPTFNYLFHLEKSFCNADFKSIQPARRFYFGNNLGLSYNLIQSDIVVRLEGHLELLIEHGGSPGLALVTIF